MELKFNEISSLNIQTVIIINTLKWRNILKHLKIYSISKHYGLGRRKSAATQLVISLAQESLIDLNSVDRFPKRYSNIYPTICNVTQFMWKLLYMFRVVQSPIIRSANNCIYSIWYLSHRYCYLPLSWKSWNWFECIVGGVRSFARAGQNSSRN
jgi:hypothetical protein